MLSSHESDRQGIGELLRAWSTSFNAQDLEALPAYYPPDAVFMPPNASPIIGSDKIMKEWFAPMFSAYNTEILLAPDEIQVDRHWGFVRGSYVVRVAPKAGGELAEERGSFLDVVSKDPDGTWKIARAIWHSDA